MGKQAAMRVKQGKTRPPSHRSSNRKLLEQLLERPRCNTGRRQLRNSGVYGPPLGGLYTPVTGASRRRSILNGCGEGRGWVSIKPAPMMVAAKRR
jgi:hypothetical protein